MAPVRRFAIPLAVLTLGLAACGAGPEDYTCEQIGDDAGKHDELVEAVANEANKAEPEAEQVVTNLCNIKPPKNKPYDQAYGILTDPNYSRGPNYNFYP